MIILAFALVLAAAPTIAPPVVVKPVPAIIHLPTLPPAPAPRKPVHVDLGQKTA